ncbi:GntR family transcriptional regulator [Fervidobacterium islandicum]|uniref:GntR family transcriptional regulator n=1 Tax=Fervidobacterium islandicum TaxID=2423 RepID=A0AAI8CLX6_FERIS|nr:GntR family transcriptional regulator [Fervidobacterium islandicum]AMW32837.1 GntR family transcriptional regulator [Fervidobacterium islandicum]
MSKSENFESLESVHVTFRKIDKHSGVPAYLQIVNQIKAKIILGELRLGMQLPAVRDLERIFDVNVNTVLKALERLKYERLVESEQGVGYFISGELKIDKEAISELCNVIKKVKESGIDMLTLLTIIEEVWKNV